MAARVTILASLTSVIVFAGCPQPGPEEPEARTAPDEPVGPCTYREVTAQCKLIGVTTEPPQSDDTLCVTVAARYESLPVPDTTRPIGPLIERVEVPREREPAIREHFQAHAQVPCEVTILDRGACPPDTTRVESLEIPRPPIVAPHPAVSKIVLSSATSPNPVITLTPEQGANFSRALSALEKHGFFEPWPAPEGAAGTGAARNVPARNVPAPTPPPDTIKAELADGTSRVIAQEPQITDPPSQVRFARFAAIRNALGSEIADLPPPWRQN